MTEEVNARLSISPANEIAILKKDGWEVLDDSTLKHMNKKELAEYIRCLEHNWACALQRLRGLQLFYEKVIEEKTTNEQ